MGATWLADVLDAAAEAEADADADVAEEAAACEADALADDALDDEPPEQAARPMPTSAALASPVPLMN